MSRITENLKLYTPFSPFRGRVLLVGFSIQAFFILLIILLNNHTEARVAAENIKSYKLINIYLYIFFLVAMFQAGTMLSMVQLDIITKHFSICLPLRNKTIINFIFSAGAALNITYTLILLSSLVPSWINGILFFITTFALGIFSFLSGLWAVFFVKNNKRGLLPSIFIVPLSVPVIVVTRQDYFSSFENLLMYISIPSLLFTALFFLMIHRRMISTTFIRRYFTSENLKSFESIPLEKRQEVFDFLKLKKLTNRVDNEDSIEKLFSKAINRSSLKAINRAALGSVYCMIDRLFVFNKNFFKTSQSIKTAALSLLFILSGYLHFNSSIFLFDSIITFTISIYVVSSLTPVHHNNLLPTGRSVNFLKSIKAWSVKPFIATAWISLLILLTHLISSYMPDLQIADCPFIYQENHWSLLLWPLVIVPLFDTFEYYLKSPCNAFIMTVHVLVIMFLGLISILTWGSIYSFLFLLTAILSANLFFLIELKRFWLAKDIEYFI